MPDLHLDFETRSACELKSAGVYRYAEDPSTSVWCCAYAIDNGPIMVWTPGDRVPDPIWCAVSDGWSVTAHNSQFERTIWRLIMVPRYGWPVPDDDQWHCTAAMAAAMALPRDLAGAARALNLDVQKDADGHKLMMQMAKPRARLADGSFTWWDDDDRKERLISYCQQDVRTERALGKLLLPLPPDERALFLLDQKINDRGVLVDLPLVEKSRQVVDGAMLRLNRQIGEATAGAVQSTTQVAKLTRWLQMEGVDTVSLSKASMLNLLTQDQDLDIEWALLTRQEAAKSSTSKLKALTASAGADGRARGMLQFLGAQRTGRFAGRLFQPQNLPRGSLPKGIDPEDCIPALMTGDEALVDALWAPPLDVVSSCLRSMLVAEQNKRLISADYANIEGRVLAWLAGEQWKLQAFRAFDAGTGPDLYKVAAAAIFGTTVEAVTDGERQLGKVSELACIASGQPVLTHLGCCPIEDVTTAHVLWDGDAWVKHDGVVFKGIRDVITYEGLTATPDHVVFTADGGEKTLGAAAAARDVLRVSGPNPRTIRHGPDFTHTYDILNAGPQNRFTVAGKLVHNCGFQGGVGAFQTMAAAYKVQIPDEQAEEIKKAWRKANPAIVAFWRACDDAAAQAVANPRTAVDCGPVRFAVAKNFLWIKLPSGRRLCYAAPYLRKMWSITLKDGAWFQVPEGRLDRHVRYQEAVTAEQVENIYARQAVCFWGVDSLTKRWGEHFGYGGLWTENITQAVARDVLAAGMLQLDRAGYHLILSVHDEVVCEEDEGWGSVEEVERIMCDSPDWLAGCPVAAKGWAGKRYGKA